jgi:HK97 family phage major capsid protein
MATYEELIAQYENERKTAERKVTDSKAMAKKYVDALEAAGLENLSPEQERMTESLYGKHREAIDDVRRAEGALKALRDAQAEDAEADRRSREVRNTPVSLAGGDSTSHIGRQDGSVAPGAVEAPTWRYSDTGKPATLGRGQQLADHEAAQEYAARNSERDRILVGTHGSLAQQIRALSTSGASAVVPTTWSFPIIDRARNASVAYQAGAVTVPMPSKVVQVGRLTTDPTATFKTEGSAITASDPAFDFIQFTATSLTALTVASLEFLQDAPNADQVVGDAIAKAMALELDKAVFFGQMTTGNEGFNLPAPYPKGILKSLLDNAAGQVLGGVANGTTQTAATFYRELEQLVYQMLTNNESVGAMVSNAKLQQQYVDAYDTTNQPLRKPVNLESVPWLITNMIPSFTSGTMTSRATDVFAGDFSQVLIGERMSLEVRVLTERYSELGQVGILAYWRGDVQLARYKALACFRYLQGAV